MADSPPQNTKRNPNWGGRREGSGRKKQAPMLPVTRQTAFSRAPIDTICTYRNSLIVFFFSSLSTLTDATQTQVVNSSTQTPTRGFFAPRNSLSIGTSSTILEGTNQDSEQREGAVNQANCA